MDLTWLGGGRGRVVRREAVVGRREDIGHLPASLSLRHQQTHSSCLSALCNLVVEMPIYISFALWFSFPISIFHLSCSFDCGGREETLAGWVQGLGTHMVEICGFCNLLDFYGRSMWILQHFRLLWQTSVDFATFQTFMIETCGFCLCINVCYFPK